MKTTTVKKQNSNLKYNLGDKVPAQENIVYAFQHVIFFVASAIVMPVVIGNILGLDQQDVASTVQRTLVLCGVVSILQTRIGHRYPIMEAPAGLWSGLFILMATMTLSAGGDLSLLRTNLEFGVIAAGIFVILLVLLGVVEKLLKLFNPLINGILMMLMVLQISPSIAKGMAGIGGTNIHINFVSVGIFLFTMMVILLLSTYAKGFIKSIATFIGVIFGWILAWVVGITENSSLTGNSILSLPEPFDWGMPTFDAGTVITCIIAAFVLLSMQFASLNGTAEAVEDDITPSAIKRSIGLHGFSTMLTGIFSTIPFMSYVSSAGIVKMTGVAARAPFYIASIFMVVMGLITPIGIFFSTIPGPVGYAAVIIVFSMIFGQAMREFKNVQFENRESMIVGISILIGVGIMFLPSTTFENVNPILASLLSNGLICGMIMAFLLEHVILRQKGRKNEGQD